VQPDGVGAKEVQVIGAEGRARAGRALSS
jgi:hypothetical protein